MKNLLNLLKATAIGGLVFLIPLVLAGILLAKAFEIMRLVAGPLQQWLGVGPSSGIVVGNLLVVALLLVVCLVAGLVAKSAPGRRLWTGVETQLSSVVPGYGFVKGFTDSLAESDEVARSFTPVLVRFDDTAQIAFEVERSENGAVVVYLPGAPNPWSGSVVLLSADRVEPVKLSMGEAIKSIQRLGRGSASRVAAQLGC